MTRVLAAGNATLAATRELSRTHDVDHAWRRIPASRAGEGASRYRRHFAHHVLHACLRPPFNILWHSLVCGSDGRVVRVESSGAM